MIEAAEEALHELGFRVCRVRHHDTLARLEIGSDEMALEAFSALLDQQPDAEFDSVRTSPKVLRIFDEARRLMLKQANAQQQQKRKAKERDRNARDDERSAKERAAKPKARTGKP